MSLIGIDLGTTSVKVCLFDLQNQKVIAEIKRSHDATIGSGLQNAIIVIQTAKDLIKSVLPKSVGIPVKSIAITGQMHGVVCWKSETLKQKIKCSPLYTWMYANDSEIMKRMPKSSVDVHDGFGARTLLELHAKNELSSYDRCGTIMDFFAAIVTGNVDVVMSSQLAQSWGYTNGEEWDSALTVIENDLHLPEIRNVTEYNIIGTVSHGEIGDELDGVPVLLPLGDLQASVASVASNGDDNEAILILGTSAQLCLLSSVHGNSDCTGKLECLPYDSVKGLIAYRAMNGGNAVDSFLQIFNPYCKFDVNSLMRGVDKIAKGNSPSIPQCVPLFLQERGDPHEGASFSGIKSGDTLEKILLAICYGVIDNLFSHFPVKKLKDFGVRQLKLVGNASCSRYKVRIKEYCGNDIEIVDVEHECSAAYGVVIFYSNILSKESIIS